MDNIATVIIVTLVSSVVASATKCDVDRPLGLQSGEIKDSQITASSSFTSAVGPQMARLGSNIGGGAWCPAGLVSLHSDTQQWIQIRLGKKMLISGTFKEHK